MSEGDGRYKRLDHEGGGHQRRVGIDRKPEYIDEDPKDGELYLERTKPGETLVEVRSAPNVQIGRQI